MKPFLVRIEREAGGRLVGTIHPSALADALGVLKFDEPGMVASGMNATLPAMALRETGYAPYLDGDELRVSAEFEREMEMMAELLMQANKVIKAQQAAMGRRRFTPKDDGAAPCEMGEA